MNRKIFLACSTNERWYPNIRPYLHSINLRVAVGAIQPYLVCVNFDPPSDLPPLITGVRVDTKDMAYAPPLDHPQSGGFLSVLPAAPEDVIIFTDGDIIMQRPFHIDEIIMLQTWPGNLVGLGCNAGAWDTLYMEAMRLAPRKTPPVNDQLKYRTVPVYNTGVAIATREMWGRWYQETCRTWEIADDLFDHYAKQQWAMSLALWEMTPRPKVYTLPYTFHTHGCYPFPEGARITGNNVLKHQDDIVLFRHHC